MGGKCVLAAEYDPTAEGKRQFAQDAYKVLHPDTPVVGDVFKLDAKDVPDCDVLSFTTPCQSFSVAGKRLGFEDTRGTLVFEALRIAKEKRPKALFMENVKGLVNHLSDMDLEAAIERQFTRGGVFWEQKGNSVTIKSDIAKKNVVMYLLAILQQNSDSQPDKSSISAKSMSDSLIEKTAINLGVGLSKRLTFLKTEILQTTKKLKDSQGEQTQQFVYSAEGLGLILSQLNLTDNSIHMDTNTLESTADMLSEVVSKWSNNSDENLLKRKLYITSTEESQMTELKTFIYATIELSIVVFILKHLTLSESLLKKVSSALTKQKDATFTLGTMDVMLESFNAAGYTVDFNVLNSKYFGVPQNRERVFIIGIRDDLIDPQEWNPVGNTMLPKAKRRLKEAGLRTFNFDWPEQENVTKRLRDVLEAQVDEKYYLSEDKTAKLVAELEAKGNGTTDVKQFSDGEGVACCVDASYAKGTAPGDFGKGRRTHVLEGLPIREVTTKGYAVAAEGDAVNIQFPNSKTRQGRVGTQMANTLEASGCNQGVVVSEEVRPVITPDRTDKRQNGRRFKDDGEEAFTCTAIDRHGVAIGEYPRYRIRKLTPRECMRLQGFPESATDTLYAEGFSDSRIYKFAGNAVTTTVIKALGERLVKYLGESEAV